MFHVKLMIMSILFMSSAWALNEAFYAQAAADIYKSTYLMTTKYKALGFSIRYKIIDSVPIVLLQNKREQIIVVRGTNSIENWNTNANVRSVPYNGSATMRVHSSYYHSARSITKDLKEVVDKKLPISCVGHSLGGAIALFIGLELQEQGYKTNLHTYGMPAVGNETFIHYAAKLRHKRYVHVLDIIPSLIGANLETLQQFAQAFEKELTQEEKFLHILFVSLEHIPKEFVQDRTPIMLYTITLPKQDILPAAWMMPAYYHLASNYAHVLISETK